MNKTIGKVIQILGPVVDIEFNEDNIPAIYNALTIVGPDKKNIVVEVAQHLGAGRVRAVSIGSTDGLQRGQDAHDTGSPIQVPVGKEILGRMFNLLGEPIDEMGPVVTKEKWSIHRKPPAFSEQSTKVEIFETGIKVIDLICPFIKGGKIGLFGGAGVGKTVLLQ